MANNCLLVKSVLEARVLAIGLWVCANKLLVLNVCLIAITLMIWLRTITTKLALTLMLVPIGWGLRESLRKTLCPRKLVQLPNLQLALSPQLLKSRILMRFTWRQKFRKICKKETNLSVLLCQNMIFHGTIAPKWSIGWSKYALASKLLSVPISLQWVFSTITFVCTQPNCLTMTYI